MLSRSIRSAAARPMTMRRVEYVESPDRFVIVDSLQSCQGCEADTIKHEVQQSVYIISLGRKIYLGTEIMSGKCRVPSLEETRRESRSMDASRSGAL
jgi:hypothetical protein